MHYARIIPALLVITLLFISPSQLNATEFDYHVLNAGINLGWAKATVELLGANSSTLPYLTSVIENATAHLSAAQNLVIGSIWEFIQLTDVNDDLQRFLSEAGSNAQQDAARLANVQSIITQRLSNYVRSPGNIESGPTCPGKLFNAGFQFGRAHVGVFSGNENYHQAAKGEFIRTVDSGLKLAPVRDCDFASKEEWNALPYGAPFDAAVYEATLYPMQVLAWELNDFTLPPPPPAPPSLPPLTADPDPVASALPGTWVTDTNATIEFVRTNSGNIVGKIVQLDNGLRNRGFSTGDVIIEITNINGNRHTGPRYFDANSRDSTGITIIVNGDTAEYYVMAGARHHTWQRIR